MNAQADRNAALLADALGSHREELERLAEAVAAVSPHTDGDLGEALREVAVNHINRRMRDLAEDAWLNWDVPVIREAFEIVLREWQAQQ